MRAEAIVVVALLFFLPSSAAFVPKTAKECRKDRNGPRPAAKAAQRNRRERQHVQMARRACVPLAPVRQMRVERRMDAKRSVK